MDDFIQVQVPKQYVPEVYGLIASLARGAGSSTQPTSGDGAASEEWTRERIERQFIESRDSMKRIQKHLAANPGREFTITELQTMLGERNANAMVGIFGAFGRRIKKYGMTEWPFAARWDEPKGKMYYSMGPEVAKVLKAL